MEVLRNVASDLMPLGKITEHSDSLILIKNRYFGSPRILTDNTQLNRGNFIGNIHLYPIFSGQPASDIAAAKAFTREAITGLLHVATDCRNNEQGVRDIVAFHGISDVIRPAFARAIGMPEKSLSLYHDQLKMKNKIAEFRQEHLDSDYERHQVKDIYELWLSRNELISLRSNFEDLLSRI